jgi:transposase-like protein
VETVIIYDKYTLTRDGKVFNSKTNHEFKPNSKGMVKVNNGKSISIRKQVLLNFGVFTCTHCKQEKPKEQGFNKRPNILSYVCHTCGKNLKRISANKRYKLNPEPHKAFHQKQINNLTDSYVAGVIGYSVKLLPNELINAKRQQLKLRRTWNQQQNS